MRSGNPVLREKTFEQFAATESAEVMTVQGTINCSATLIAILVAASAVTWWFVSTTPAAAIPLMIGGVVGGLVFALIICFKPHLAPSLASVYAIVEGLVLGAISCFMNEHFPGIVAQAIGLTLGVFVMMLVIYRTRLIRVTEGFKAGVIAATGAICLVYLVSFVLRLFGLSVPFIHDSGWIGIGFSLFVIVIAALNLVLDFHFIEQGAAFRAPKYMQWYAAFGLLVTLVWLYLEILRLLAKLQRR